MIADRLTTCETPAAHRLDGAAEALRAKVPGARRTTIGRDRQTLALADQLYQELLAAAPWVPSADLTVAEVADRLGCFAKPRRYMLRAGPIRATKEPAGRGRRAAAALTRRRKKEPT